METTIRSDRPPRRRACWLCRLALATALLLSTLGPLASTTAASLQSESIWSDPNGAFTLAWSDPWYALRQEEQVIGLGDGVSIVTTGESAPLPGIPLTFCPEELAAVATGAPVNPGDFIEKHVSTWRAWATLDHPASGLTEYFECQVTPDGASVAYFVGGTQTSLVSQGIPSLEAFVRDGVVKQPGETAPAIASNGWRVGLVEWSRSKAFGDIGLTRLSPGEDYAVFVVDIANWQAATTELSLDAFRLEAIDGSQTFPVDVERSNLVAASLGEAALESGVPISVQPGASHRAVLVFAVDSELGDLALFVDDAGIALEADPGLEIFGALRPPASLPNVEAGTVSNVIDGRTLVVSISETGQSARVRLIGVAAPEDDAAKEFLSTYLGQTVLLESDPAHPDDNRLQRYVWVNDTAGLPAMANNLLMEQGLASYESSGTTGRFDALIAAANRLPASGPESRHQPPPMRVEPNVTPPAGLSEADLAYLAELSRYRDNLVLGLQFYDLHMTAPTFDGEFSGQLGIMVLGWSVFYDGLVKLEPTSRFADLHARLLAAFEPFDTLAYQIEPALDQILGGETPAQPFAGFDYDVMTNTVATARPALEQVLAEIDAVLEAEGITSEGGPIR